MFGHCDTSFPYRKFSPVVIITQLKDYLGMVFILPNEGTTLSYAVFRHLYARKLVSTVPDRVVTIVREGR